MLFKSVLAATLAASVLAQPLAHQHHQHEKKDVVQTVVVTVLPGAGSPTAAAAPAAATSAAAAPVSGSSSAPAAASSGSSGSSGSSVGSGAAGAKGITYSPYNGDGSCKSAGQVKSDLAQLKGFNLIRLYGVDCNQVPNVLAALSPGQKIFAGIFNVGNIAGDISTLASAVSAAGGWSVVDTVSIGNELVNSGQANVGQIQSYVDQGRSALKAAGYNGPVVSVDTFIAVINNPGLCACSDYVAVNAHAFFDGHVVAENAGDWVLQQLQRVSSACGGKKVVITESGWPNRGNANGQCVPGVQQQQAAIASIKSKCGDATILFNAFDDLWKSDNAYTFGAEKYWGIYGN